jgi:hypothetical protein
MRARKPLRIWLVAACLAACGGDGDTSDAAVIDLETAEQRALCADFLATLCADPGPAAEFCAMCPAATVCAPAAEGPIDVECAQTPAGAAITVSMVEACAEANDLETCQMGGGCMIDAVEAVCEALP